MKKVLKYENTPYLCYVVMIIATPDCKPDKIQNTYKMYTFLKNRFPEIDNVTRYFAIPEDKIETLNLHDTYDRNGQQIGHTNAGDYSIDNEYCDAESDCLEALKQKFNITSLKNDFNDPARIDFLQIRGFEIYNNSNIDESDIENYDEEKINAFIAEWEKENAIYETVQGFDYWDGSNWDTITTASEHGEPSHEVISDDELTSELNEAIESREFQKEGFGKKIFIFGNWVIVDSYVQGTWASYEIFPADEVEIENL